MLTDNPLSNKLRQLLHQYGLSQLIVEPTRITSDSQTLIDIIATSHPRNYERCGITPCSISDHLLVFAEQTMRVTPLPVETITVRCYNKCNWQALLEDRMNAPWQSIEQYSDVDSAWNYWKYLKHSTQYTTNSCCQNWMVWVSVGLNLPGFRVTCMIVCSASALAKQDPPLGQSAAESLRAQFWAPYCSLCS